MNDDSDIDTLSKEIKHLKSRLDSYQILLGILGIFVALLSLFFFMNHPGTFFLIVIMAIILIPIAAVLNYVERGGA